MKTKTTTTFYGLNIVHPHSGKVSRSVVSRIVKHAANGYFRQSDEQNAMHLLNYGEKTIVLKDHNGKIELDYTSVN